MRYIFCSSFFLIFTLAVTAWGQTSLNSATLAHQYSSDSEVNLTCKPVEAGDSLYLFLNLVINQGKPQLTDYTFKFYTANTYNDELIALNDSKMDSAYLGGDVKGHNFRFSIAGSELLSLLAVEVTSRFSGFSYFYDFNTAAYPLTLKDDNGNIQFNAWLAPGSYQFNTSDHVFGYYYAHTFPPALPPMPVKDAAPEREMVIDSTFTTGGDATLTLGVPGLYLFQLDSSSTKGLSFRLENKYFPKLAKLENLTEPLIYITTKEENTKLQAINGNKKEFDRFWLELTNSTERARDIIKTYFERVEQANRLFTTFKEGWKTDMGMIYIIFGPPDEVTKTVNGETWQYLASLQLPRLRFDFIRTASIFTPAYYVLVREKHFASAWYKAVDLWRKGRF